MMRSLPLWLFLAIIIMSIASFSTSNLLKCCPNHIAEETVIDCLDEIITSKFISPVSSIALVSYFTPSVKVHSLLTVAINSVYSEQHDNSIYVFSSVTGQNHDTNDQRWNKVKIIYDIMLNTSLLHEYYIWVDSDLIIANHSLDFQKLISQYNWADIIISEEINKDNGLINTGCMIIRKSLWSIKFFNEWWNSWDRAAGMDQHVFDYLYHHNIELDCRKHVAILPCDAINSKFPGLVHHQTHNPILHLAGESNFIRAFIAKQSWNALCRYYNNYSSNSDVDEINEDYILPPLGIDRKFLDSIDYVELHRIEWNSISPALENMEINEQTIATVRYRIREAQQSLSKFVCSYSNMMGQQIVELSGNAGDNNSNCIELKSLFYDQAINSLITVWRKSMELLQLVKLDGVSDRTRILNLHQSVLDAGLEVLTLLKLDHIDYADIVSELLPIVDDLISLTNANNKQTMKIILYYQFKLYEFLARHYAVNSNTWTNATISYNNAFLLWQHMVEDYGYLGSGNNVRASYGEGIVVLKNLMLLQYLIHAKSDCLKTANLLFDYARRENKDLDCQDWLINIDLSSITSAEFDKKQLLCLEIILMQKLCEISEVSQPATAVMNDNNNLFIQKVKREFEVLKSEELIAQPIHIWSNSEKNAAEKSPIQKKKMLKKKVKRSVD